MCPDGLSGACDALGKGRAARTPIVFGGQTALRLYGVANGTSSFPLVKKRFLLPGRLPEAGELAYAFECLEARLPGIGSSSPAHLFISSSEGRRKVGGCSLHVCAHQLPTCSVRRIADGVYASVPQLAVIQAAARESELVPLLMLLWEVCGTYRTQLTGVEDAYQVRPLTNVGSLSRYAERVSTLDGARKVARALRYVADGSASARESKLALLLGLPRMYGGFGLGVPKMNHRIDADPGARAIAGKRFFRADLCWPEAKLDVEYQSDETHEGEKKRIEDSRRVNALVSMGWHVVCVTKPEMDSAASMIVIAETIRRRMGKRVRSSVNNHRVRMTRLRRQLGLAPGFR